MAICPASSAVCLVARLADDRRLDRVQAQRPRRGGVDHDADALDRAARVGFVADATFSSGKSQTFRSRTFSK